MRRAALPLALAVAMLAGCSGLTAPPPAAAPQPVALDLDPARFGPAATLDQVVTGTFQGQSRTMRVVVEVSAQALRMTALSPLGMPLFTLEHDGRRLEAASTAGQPLPVEPAAVLADFQFAFWPAAGLGPALAARGYTLRVAEDGARSLHDRSGALLARTSGPPADITGNPSPEVVVTRLVPRYELRIRTKRMGAPT